MEVRDNNLCIILPWEHNDEPVTIKLSAPHAGNFDKSIPGSLRQFLKTHNGISLIYADTHDESMLIEGVGHDGELIEDGGWDAAYIEEGGNEDVINYLDGRDKSLDEVICFGSYDMRQNWYLLHPKKKNSAGVHCIVLFDHEDCDMSETSDLTFCDFLIAELASSILEVYHQDGEDSARDSTENLVSSDFHAYLRTKMEGFDPTTAKNFKGLNWDEIATDIYQSIIKYWARITENENASIGIFDIRWEDASNTGIEFDYEENNDLKTAMEGGCIRDELVIDLDKLFLDKLGFEEHDRDEDNFQAVKDIFCILSQELIVKSVLSDSFVAIKKHDPHYIQFAYWHDEEAKVIYDSTAEGATSIYPKEEDLEAEVMDLFFDFQVVPEAFGEDCMKLYNKLNNFIKGGDFGKAKQIVYAFIDNYRDMDNAEEALLNVKMLSAVTGSQRNFFESFAADALALGVMSRDSAMIDIGKELTPNRLTDPVLAFNLACLAALAKDKGELVKRIAEAVALGKHEREFMQESDFDFYREDSDFRAAINGM